MTVGLDRECMSLQSLRDLNHPNLITRLTCIHINPYCQNRVALELGRNNLTGIDCDVEQKQTVQNVSLN